MKLLAILIFVPCIQYCSYNIDFRNQGRSQLEAICE